MNPHDAAYWWGVASGVLGTFIISFAVVVLCAVFAGRDSADFTGEHHDGRP
jgi:hypothetical protein